MAGEFNGVSSNPGKVFTTDALAQELGLNADGTFVQRDYVAALLDRQLLENGVETLDDICSGFATIPEKKMTSLLDKRLHTDTFGARTQIMLRLLDNIKSLNEGDLEIMRTQLNKKEHELQEEQHKRIFAQNGKSLPWVVITVAVTGLLTWIFKQNYLKN